MITSQTASDIWNAYREITVAEKLLADMKAAREKPFAERDAHAPTLKDSFGYRQHLQLGIPSGSNSHRLFDVDPVLAESVIIAHIAKKKLALVEANECARIELSMESTAAS
jgi:hypothetical protein